MVIKVLPFEDTERFDLIKFDEGISSLSIFTSSSRDLTTSSKVFLDL